MPVDIKKYHLLFLCAAAMLVAPACKNGNPEISLRDAVFESMPASATGITFNNALKPTAALNLFNYIYFYNGGGVAAGDFNNDGKIDLFFAANEGRNRLYRNKGNLKFEDITDQAGIKADSAWSTGVSVVDINNDGMLDIYVCRVGKYLGLNSQNQLLVCKSISAEGIPSYEDEAKQYGIDFSGFGTQAVFFDYDLDGDLDLFLLTHSVHATGAFAPRATYAGTFHPLAGDRMYLNESGKFRDITAASGVSSTAIGYGLGVGVSDLNLDGYPDLYVANDFPENDYLYINQKNGSFKDEIDQRIMHTSQFSMGVDIADANNDGLPEIISLDMMPHDPEILKRSQLEEAYDAFQLKRDYGFNYQYTRNNLQYNRGNGMFSELGQYAGIFDTDWSWSPLWMDFDNDGKKDLFVSNGIPKRMNDLDFIRYISDDAFRQKLGAGKIEELEVGLLDKFPQNKLRNKFFENTGDLRFRDMDSSIYNNAATYGNGAVYADLDNDGDLDIVVNNIDDEASVYRNTSNDNKSKPYVDVTLKGPAQNRNAIGAKILLYAGNEIRVMEKWPVHGYLSSMEIPLHIGMVNTHADSLILIWPDNSFQRLDIKSLDTNITVSYSAGLQQFDYNALQNFNKPSVPVMHDITAEVHLDYRHKENAFVNFNWEPLMPHMLSTEGPALAVGDLNGDGRDDVFVGASKGQKSALFFQSAKGDFQKATPEEFSADSLFEDVDATIVDLNGDKLPDLVVASGGNEYTTLLQYMQPRVYLNNGKGHLTRKVDAIANVRSTISSVAAADFNGDGFTDLFFGGRSVAWEYGQIPASYLFLNDGKGNFKDVTDAVCPDLRKPGMVTAARWLDLDKDGDNDLLIAMEWGPVYVFINEHGKLQKQSLTDKKGWWNFILPVDINQDGNIDLVAGNMGLNNFMRPSEKQPVNMYYYDFDGNGKKEQIVTYYQAGKKIPLAGIEEIEKKLPGLKKKFLYAGDFAKASLDEIFSHEKLSRADSFSATSFANSLLLNNGTNHFETMDLPWQAQLSTMRDAVVVNANGDSLPDLLLFGNYYENSVEMGRNDADYGTLLVNKGGGRFSASGIPGLVIKGQVRHVRPIKIGKRDAFVLARNNDTVMVIAF